MYWFLDFDKRKKEWGNKKIIEKHKKLLCMPNFWIEGPIGNPPIIVPNKLRNDIIPKYFPLFCEFEITPVRILTVVMLIPALNHNKDVTAKRL